MYAKCFVCGGVHPIKHYKGDLFVTCDAPNYFSVPVSKTKYGFIATNPGVPFESFMKHWDKMKEESPA